MIRIIVLAIVLALSGCAMSPLQEMAKHDAGFGNDDEHIMWTAEQVAEKLSPHVPDILVQKGNYKILKTHEMPFGYWCSPHNTFGDPPGWDCQDYAEWADDQREGYAYGLVWNLGHMLNIGLVEDCNGKVWAFFYEPQKCLWVDAPDGIEKAFVN